MRSAFRNFIPMPGYAMKYFQKKNEEIFYVLQQLKTECDEMRKISTLFSPKPLPEYLRREKIQIDVIFQKKKRNQFSFDLIEFESIFVDFNYECHTNYDTGQTLTLFSHHRT